MTDDDELSPDNDERDYWQEYKDGVATGQLNEDGTQREPDEPDWGALADYQHDRDVHGGGDCDCPPAPADPAAIGAEDPWAITSGEPGYATEAPF